LTAASPISEITDTPSSTTEIDGQAGQPLQIEVSSYQFDPQLILIDPAGNVIAQDDDGGGNFNARLDITLPQSGVYRVIVAATTRQAQGGYRLRVN
jgi:serine protease Do